MAIPTEVPEGAEEPDFDEDDEQAMDAVWDRIHRGESLDEIIGDSEDGGHETPDDLEDDSK